MTTTNWKSSITELGHHKINVRGYPLREIIRKLTFAEVVYLTIKGDLPDKAQARVMDAILCSIVDHALFSPTSLTARFIASSNPDNIMKGIAGALLTVGSVTVSPQDTAEIIEEAMLIVNNEGLTKKEAAAKIIAELHMQKRRMPGLGHPLHPKGDPRSTALKDVARQNGVWGEKGEMYEALHNVFNKFHGKSLPINIDGMMGCVLSELGFKPNEMAGIAAISFMPGIIAHAVEENCLRKFRFAECEYTGVPERELPDNI